MRQQNKNILFILFLLLILGIAVGIFTGKWKILSIPLAYFLFLSTLSYLSLYSKWQISISVHLFLFFGSLAVKGKKIYAVSDISSALLIGVAFIGLWGLIAQLFVLHGLLGDYKKIYPMDNKWKNFSDYYSNHFIPKIRNETKLFFLQKD